MMFAPLWARAFFRFALVGPFFRTGNFPMTASAIDVQQLAINTIRTLSMDAVQRANSGHPGTPMALAPVAYLLYRDYLRFDPAHPEWMSRDRFILSCGHASMLQYALLHLAEVRAGDRPAITMDDIRNFRQLESPCAGHPEFGEAPGIETTTGPLGQGIGNSVGMAVAGLWRAARYDRPDHELFGFDVYALCSDGDIMEGVGAEAASLAGHLGLSNLCWIYDDNRITIEGRTDLAFSEDVAARFESLGWRVEHVADANDLEEMGAALDGFRAETDRPTLIVVRSIIGYGAPHKQDTADAHGSPLGEEEIRLAKEAYGWPVDSKFEVPPEVREHFRETIGTRGGKAYREWLDRWNGYRDAWPREAADLEAMQNRQLPANWEQALPEFPADTRGMATRVSSGKVLNALGPVIPWLLGGSADLAGSTKTILTDKDAGHFSRDEFRGRNFHFGIREHGMAAMANGMALVGLRPYCATFFVFTDYLRPSLRLSSLMKLPVLYVLTHDSIGLGEDGPTHQPVEHLAACRAIPGLQVMRPADANEVAVCYQAALSESDRPTAMVLTRQDVATLDRGDLASAHLATRGGYTLRDCEGTPELILMGTGSELHLCLAAAETLVGEGVRVRVVSLPCLERFAEQPAAYRDEVLPPEVTARVAVEAGIQMGWERWLGPRGRFIGMTGFGASAPFEVLYDHFGITAEAIEAAARELLQNQ